MLVAAAAFAFASLLIPTVSAQQSGSGLQISPTRSEVSASPGEQKSFTVSIKNITNGDLTAKAVLNDFESDNVSGTPKIQTDTTKRTPYSLNSMLSGLKDVQLKAGETKEIRLTVDVPGNASPGAYFGAIRYSVVPQGTNPSERQIALNASVAHLVFVEVAGTITQQIKINSLKFERDGKASSLFTSTPDKAALSVENLGNGFARPFGTVTIKNGFGKQVHSYEVNNSEQKGMVLPNSSRTFTNDVAGVKLPGRYSAIASVAYGNGGEVVTYQSTFWYLPVWFLISLAVLILLIIAGLFYLKKRFFSKRRR